MIVCCPIPCGENNNVFPCNLEKCAWWIAEGTNSGCAIKVIAAAAKFISDDMEIFNIAKGHK